MTVSHNGWSKDENHDYSWVDGPTPVDYDVRICFSIAWYDTEAKALEKAEINRKQNVRVNGGWLDDMLCGRDAGFDYIHKETGQKRYACLC